MRPPGPRGGVLRVLRTSPNRGEQLGREPLLHQDAVLLDEVRDQREPALRALPPLNDDAWMRARGVGAATNPAVPAAARRRWDGVRVPSSRPARHGTSVTHPRTLVRSALDRPPEG